MFTLNPLSYKYHDLEPYIDAKTMELHYSKHHQTYVDKLNSALENYPELLGQDIADLVKDINNLPEPIRQAVRNHGGGHYNHTIFWDMMSPDPNAQAISDGLSEFLVANFGDLENFKNRFSETATLRFGSGWAWLAKKDDKLDIFSTANQDTPLELGYQPILGLDVWEHAYYLKYQNRRPEYIDAWWNIVNWREVERRLHQ